MTLAAGSVTVASDESETGSGCALALYLADKATLALPPVPTAGDTSGYGFSSARPCSVADVDAVKAARLVLLRDAARRATAYGSVIPYFLANYEADLLISPTTGGLQQYNPGSGAVDTLPPAFPGKHLAVTIA